MVVALISSADALRSFIAPLLPGWRIQFGRWTDGGKTSRYAVLRPVGGLPASLVRRPQFSLVLIAAGADAEQVPLHAAESVISAMRGCVGMEPGEPARWIVDDGRPAYEVAVLVDPSPD